MKITTAQLRQIIKEELVRMPDIAGTQQELPLGQKKPNPLDIAGATPPPKPDSVVLDQSYANLSKASIFKSLDRLKGFGNNNVEYIEKDGYKYFISKRPKAMQHIFTDLFLPKGLFDNIKLNSEDMRYLEPNFPFVEPAGYLDSKGMASLPPVFHPTYFTEEAFIRMIDKRPESKSKSSQERESKIQRNDPKMMLLMQGYLNEILKLVFGESERQVWVSGKPDLYSIVVKEPLKD